MLIKSKLHTIILLVGPSNSGKSTFVDNVIKKTIKEKYNSINFQHISSDSIRRELLGEDSLGKLNPSMMNVSKYAFELLDKKVNLITSYPINSEIVVIDTNGLNKEFRDHFIKLAEDKKYNIDVIVFDYKEREDYYSGNNIDDINKKVITRHIKTLKSDVLRDLNKNKFNNVYRIKSKDNNLFQSIDFEIENYELYNSCLLPRDTCNYNYTIIGDIHGCYNELKELIIKNGFEIDVNDKIQFKKDNKKDDRIILVGDYLDKGGNTSDTINFIYKNLDILYVIKGNHESFIYKRLKGLLDNDEEIGGVNTIEEITKENFNDFFLLESNEELKNKFFYIFESSKHFFILNSNVNGSNNFIVTHSPCPEKFLGKLDNESIKNQMKFKIDREKDIHENLKFLYDEKEFNYPFHIFGHFNFNKPLLLGNKIGIDTSCIMGNKLTSVTILNNKLFFNSIDFKNNFDKYISKIFITNKNKDDILDIEDIKRNNDKRIDDLDKVDKARFFSCIENKVNYVSGTMCPAPKNLEKNTLESLEEGLNYFKNSGINKVVLQPKYMGSRGNIYLHKDNLEECYIISRNGFKVRQISKEDQNNLFLKLQKEYHNIFSKYDAKILILDAEIMPWYSMGDGLINDTFKIIEKSLETELNILKNTGFDELLNDQHIKINNLISKDEINKISKKDLLLKYNSQQLQTYENINDFKKINYSVDKHIELLQVFSDQLNIFGSDGELDIKPFDILKIIKNDDTELFLDLNSYEKFELLKLNKEDTCLIIDFNNDEYLNIANDFYKNITTIKKMEGIVIKPLDDIYEGGIIRIAPYMKVRNKDYLTLIYGYDYSLNHKYSKLIKQKNVSKKLSISLKEYSLAMDLLKINYNDINRGNEIYKNKIIEIIFENMKEQNLDPRL